MITAMEKAHGIHDYMTAIRRDLHRHPEPSMQEFRTTDRIAAELDKLGVAYRRIEPTGIIAEIRGTAGESGTVVMLRADIDALAVNEHTGLEFASETPGMMHACGHDGHTATLLGAAKLLSEDRGSFAGTVRLIFQPGEESLAGAKVMIANGAMDGVTVGFGMHMDPLGEVGRISLRPGPAYAAPAEFLIQIEGEGCPGAMPNQGKDAALAAAAILMNLQSIPARFIRPDQPVVVTVGRVKAGTRFNVLAGHAELDGTYRTFDMDVHRQVAELIDDIAKKTAAIYGCTAATSIPMTGEPMINAPEATELVHEATVNAYGGDRLYHVRELNMGSEDFAYYGSHAPCAFAFLGSGRGYPLHHDCFCMDEAAMDCGAAMFLEFTAAAFRRYNGQHG